MATVLVKDLIEAGVHFGHRASRWNPKMRPYIYARRNLIHIIDVRETIRGLLRARKYLQKVAAQGSLVLLVGTKRQACDVDRAARHPLRHALRQRSLAGRHADQLPHDPQPARRGWKSWKPCGAPTRSATYSKKMQSALNREYRKMYRNLNGIRTMNRLPECLVVIDPRKEKNADRRGPQAGHHHRGPDRYRLRSGRGRSADSRQRRQHPLDRVDRDAVGRRDCWRARRPRAA